MRSIGAWRATSEVSEVEEGAMSSDCPHTRKGGQYSTDQSLDALDMVEGVLDGDIWRPGDSCSFGTDVGLGRQGCRYQNSEPTKSPGGEGDERVGATKELRVEINAASLSSKENMG
jgi:hypothetical protein